MTISLTPDLSTDTCLMRIRGCIDLEKVSANLDRHFEEYSSGTVVWDIRTSDVSNVTLARLRVVADEAAKWDHKRTNPRSVGVIDPGIMHMLARLFAATNIARGRPVRFRTFLNMRDALEWMQITKPQPGWLDQG